MWIRRKPGCLPRSDVHGVLPDSQLAERTQRRIDRNEFEVGTIEVPQLELPQRRTRHEPHVRGGAAVDVEHLPAQLLVLPRSIVLDGQTRSRADERVRVRSPDTRQVIAEPVHDERPLPLEPLQQLFTADDEEIARGAPPHVAVIAVSNVAHRPSGAVVVEVTRARPDRNHIVAGKHGERPRGQGLGRHVVDDERVRPARHGRFATISPHDDELARREGADVGQADATKGAAVLHDPPVGLEARGRADVSDSHEPSRALRPHVEDGEESAQALDGNIPPRCSVKVVGATVADHVDVVRARPGNCPPPHTEDLRPGHTVEAPRLGGGHDVHVVRAGSPDGDVAPARVDVVGPRKAAKVPHAVVSHDEHVVEGRRPDPPKGSRGALARGRLDVPLLPIAAALQ